MVYPGSVKFNNKFVFSLATATGVIFENNQIVKADILENLKYANEICATLKENPDAWMDAAQSFINAFDEFDKELRHVLNSEGALPLLDTTIVVEIWGKGRTFPKNVNSGLFIQEETLAELNECGPYGWHAACCDTEGAFLSCCCNHFLGLTTLGIMYCAMFNSHGVGVYYFKDHVEPILKSHIFRALNVDSLQAASAFWKKIL